MEDEILSVWKDFAKSFFPKAIVVGILGNFINFVILSRPCIKSSTNIYLSVLAFTDTSFLLLIYVSSKQYHHDVHRQENEVYWRMFGLSQWFYTSFLYISVYLTLSLTLDRFDAVRHATSTKCAIVRAKNVVSMVLLFGFILSISAAFEIQLKSNFTSEKLCKSNRSQVVENATASSQLPGYNEMPLSSLKRNDSGYNFNEDETMLLARLERSFDNDALSNPTDKNNSPKLHHKTNHNPADVDHYVNDVQRDNMTSTVVSGQNHNTCSSQFNLHPVESALAKNKFYRIILKSIGSILLIVPLVAMAGFSIRMSIGICRPPESFQLPSAVERSEKTSSDILTLRENKITLLVITLVAIFLICHTPNAVYSLFKSWLNSQTSSEEQNQIKNIILAFEISCQILMSINCCSKIFIYVLAYGEYWTSMKSLKNCFQCSNGAPREQIINTSKHLFPSTKADVESLLNYSLSKKRYATQIPPEARHNRTNNPRTHKPSYSSSTPTASITPRLSLTPSIEGIEMGEREMNRISTQPQVDRQPSMRSNMSFKALHLSPSQVSLTRSKSLNIQSSLKHSPSCRKNKNTLN